MYFFILIIIFIHQYVVDMQKIITIQQTKNLNNLTKQNVCVQYPVLQRYIFSNSLYVVFSECRSFVKNLSFLL